MKKLLVAACAVAIMGAYGLAKADQQLPLVGQYVNEVGYVVIAPAAKSQNANYDIGIMDNSGKCSLQLVAATNMVSEQESPVGKMFHPNSIVAVESEKYPAFSLWPEDDTIRLSPDALPFDKLDPACAVFKDHLVFKRK